MLQSLSHFTGLRWTPSSSSMSSLYWGAPRWTLHSRCALSSSEPRGRTTSLDLLATLLLVQPRAPLALFASRTHCWLMFNSPSTRAPRSLTAELLLNWSAPSMYWCVGLLLPRCRTLHFPLLKCMKFLSAYFFSLPRSLWMAAHNPFSYQYDKSPSRSFSQPGISYKCFSPQLALSVSA